jgi:hypothetical protein
VQDRVIGPDREAVEFVLGEMDGKKRIALRERVLPNPAGAA